MRHPCLKKHGLILPLFAHLFNILRLFSTIPLNEQVQNLGRMRIIASKGRQTQHAARRIISMIHQAIERMEWL